MGVVYRAWQHSVGRDVAIKVLSTSTGASGDLVLRFMREARLAAQLTAPTIVSVLDFGQNPDGTLFLVMELVDGETLAALVKRDGPMPWERAVRVGLQLCDALEAAHQKRIIHRDLKPANIMLVPGPGGRDLIKVLDFGLARSAVDGESITASDQIVGTANYLAPETISGQGADERSDLYALGAVLYTLIRGRTPFGKDGGFSAVVQRQLEVEVQPLNPLAPPTVDALIRRLLAVDPQARPASAAEVRERLSATLEWPSPPEPSVARDGPARRRRPWAVAGAVLGALLGLGVVTVLPLRWGASPSELQDSPSPVGAGATEVLASGSVDAGGGAPSQSTAAVDAGARLEESPPLPHVVKPNKGGKPVRRTTKPPPPSGELEGDFYTQ
jgi:serine/threonine-protein kinase